MIIERPYPLYPLCQDYESLTAEGQCQARLAVLCDQSTPKKLVLAWDFFRRIYLGGEDAAFYKNGFEESPEFHHDMVHSLGQYARNAWAAPRGYAKSTVLVSEIPLLLALTRPNYDLTTSFSTDKMVEDRFDILMQQLTQNKMILQDFGEMRPKRGRAIWNHHHLHLNNGAIIRGMSVMG